MRSQPHGKTLPHHARASPDLLTWGQPATYLRKKPLERHSSSFSLLMGQSPRKATLYHALGTGRAQLSNSLPTLLAIETPEGKRQQPFLPPHHLTPVVLPQRGKAKQARFESCVTGVGHVKTSPDYFYMVFHNDCRFLQRFYQPFQTDKLCFSASGFQVKTHTESKPMHFGYMFQRKKHTYICIHKWYLQLWQSG